MKEAGNNGGGGVRSPVEKERTKMRERQRRSITTNIFQGLRKHGGYRLSPRADINEVLRHLAHEAGWIVDPDGTTYRLPAASNGNIACPLCGGDGGRKSYMVGGGECSATTSAAANSVTLGGMTSLSGGGDESLLSVYMCGVTENACDGGGAYGKVGQEVYLLREASVSNQNTPPGST